MSSLLDVLLQEKPGQELERDVTLIREMEELHSVYDLLWRHLRDTNPHDPVVTKIFTMCMYTRNYVCVT